MAAGNITKAGGIIPSKPLRAREQATDALASLLLATHGGKKTAATRIARPGEGLTLVAVAISAGVVTDSAMAAAVAPVHMPAENRPAADLDGAHDPALCPAHGVTVR